jgi:hypothetical protein
MQTSGQLNAALITLAVAISCWPARAGNIAVQNFSNDGLQARPIVFFGSLPPLNSGSIAVGSFATLNDQALSAVGSDIMLADFIPFDDTLNHPVRLGDASAFNIAGLYAADLSAPLSPGNSLLGKNIYTVIGNGLSLASSPAIIILKDSETFQFDAPIFQASALAYDSGSTLIRGSVGAPIFIGALGASFPSIQSIPEPANILILAMAGLWLFRRSPPIRNSSRRDESRRVGPVG